METFNLTAVDDIIGMNLADTIDYREFAETIDAIYDLTDLNSYVYAEAVSTPKGRFRNNIVTTMKRTVGTTKDVYGAYHDITTGGGDIISAGWNLIMSLVSLATRCISYILTHLSKIPNGLAKLVDLVANLPSSVYHKVRGDINVYITSSDIEAIYRNHVMMKLDTFISTAKMLAQGDSWNVVSGHGVLKMVKSIFTPSDIQHCKNLQNLFREIGSLQFSPTLIDMKSQSNVMVYLSNEKSIKFTDDKGREFKGSYFDALKKLVDDLIAQQNNLKQINDMMFKKFNASQANLNFAKMTKSDQNQLTEAINSISKMIAVVANIVRYVIKDMNTISKNINAINKKYNLGKKELNKQQAKQDIHDRKVAEKQV